MVSSPGQTGAGGALLATKHYAPRWRPGLVSRPHLIARLDQGAERKLTLVAAPAGFGKTTLLEAAGGLGLVAGRAPSTTPGDDKWL